MADTPSPKTVSQTTTAVIGGLSPLTALLLLPQPYAMWAGIACAVFAGAGLAATQITLPANQSGKLWLAYRVINFLALNWKCAANAAIALRSSSAAAKAAPLVGPGSVVTIPKDDTK
nr:hypothetical protein [Acetobacter syzygii]